MEVLRKSATATYVDFPLISTANRPDFRAGESYPFVAGDVKIIKHTGGTWDVSNIGTLPAEISTTGIFLMTLTAGELTPDNTDYPVTIKIHDQTTPKIFDDTCVIVSFKRADDMVTMQTDLTTIKGYTDSIEGVLGSPAGASMSADIAAVKADAVTIKGYTDTLETVLGTPVSSVSTDIANVKADCVTIKGYTDTLETVLGTPASSVSADIAAVKSDCVTIKGYTDTLETKLDDIDGDIVTVHSHVNTLLSDTIDIKGYTDSLEGSMTTALADLTTIKGYTDSVEGDLATIKGYTDSLETTLGTPVASVSADIAAVKADAVLIKGYTDGVETLLGTPVSSVSADIASIKSDCTTLKSYTDGVEGDLTLVLADTSIIKGDTATLKSDLTPTKNDVATIKSKLPAAGDIIAADADLDDVKSKVGTIFTALPGSSATIASQNDVLAIQNNTTFAASIPTPIIQPVEAEILWIPITCQLRDSGGSMEDPDDSELTVQVRADNPFELFEDLFTTRTGDVHLVESSTWTDYYKLTRISQGLYEGWMKLTSACELGSYTFTFKFKESTVTQVFTRNTNIMGEDTNVNVVLSDSEENKIVIAEALKLIDVSEVATLAGSVMKYIETAFGQIIAKLPSSGIISNLALDDTIENITLSQILSLVMAMVDGKYTIDTETGNITFYKRDNITPLTIVTVTETSRVRASFPSY